MLPIRRTVTLMLSLMLMRTVKHNVSIVNDKTVSYQLPAAAETLRNCDGGHARAVAVVAWRGARPHGERCVPAYNGDLGAEPQRGPG